MLLRQFSFTESFFGSLGNDESCEVLTLLSDILLICNKTLWMLHNYLPVCCIFSVFPACHLLQLAVHSLLMSVGMLQM